MSDSRFRNFTDPVRAPYLFDFFDPSTWARGVFGAGSTSAGVADHDDEAAFERDVIRRRTYVGRGPKNYQRSDERIYEDVSEILMWSRDVDATEMKVEVHEGIVELTGLAPTRHQKFVAEDLISEVPGVREVRNLLRVGPNYRFGVPIGGWPI